MSKYVRPIYDYANGPAASFDTNVTRNLSYGLFVVTANQDGKDNGFISNTVIQQASDPLSISIAINKTSLTCEMIKDTKKFTASIISEDATFDLFKHFGFQSGHNVDKFAHFIDYKRTSNGTVAITKGTNSYISVSVTNTIDLGSHLLFIGTPVESEILSKTPSATYAYYFESIKPKPEKIGTTPEGKTIWRCTICGYEYVGEELPTDFICPVCNHPASYFEKIT